MSKLTPYLAVLIVIGCILNEPDVGSSQAQEVVSDNSIKLASAQSETIDLRIEAHELSPTQIEFTIRTNIPLPIEVMVGVGLAGQKPDDIYIGHNSRIRLERPITRYVLDITNARPRLPSGSYDAEVSFYRRWGAKGNPKAAIVPDLKAVSRIALTGSGKSAQQVQSLQTKQAWVMENVSMNHPWDEDLFIARLGQYTKFNSTLSHLHDAYYFPEADMTLIVNRLKNDVTIWRIGRAEK